MRYICQKSWFTKLRILSTIHQNLREMQRKEETLVKERQQLACWYKLTQRIKLKIIIRQEIANIDEELNKLSRNKSNLIGR